MTRYVRVLVASASIVALSSSCATPGPTPVEVPEHSTIIADEYDALEVPAGEPFSRHFEIESASFSIGREDAPPEDQVEIHAEGSFDLAFEPTPEGPMTIHVLEFDEVVTGVSFGAGEISVELPPIALTKDNLDLERSVGVYDPETHTFELSLVFISERLPPVPGWDAPDGLRFDETGTLDPETGAWAIEGAARFTIASMPFLASTKDKKGKSYPDKSQLAHGLLWAIRAKIQNDLVGIIDKAKSCDCRSTCMLASKQMLTGKLAKKLILDVALAVLEGTFSGAKKGLGTAGKKVLDKALDAIKKVKKENQVNTTGEKKIDVGEVEGISVNKECTVKYTLSYDKATGKVIALVQCSKCNADKSCSFLVEFTAGADGLPTGKVEITPLAG